MSDTLLKALAELEDLLREQEQEVASTKLTINSISKRVGRPEPYPDASLNGKRGMSHIRSDQFYGQPLIDAVTTILEMRQTSNLGPGTVNDIYQTLLDGGYVFNAKNDENAKRGLYGTLSKPQFHRLPGGEYGLRKWYPNIKESKDEEPEEAESGSETEESKNG